MYEDVEFKSEGSTLRGRYYKANGTRNATVVMTHGTSATITMSIDRYAEAICEAGFDVLFRVGCHHRVVPRLGKGTYTPVGVFWARTAHESSIQWRVIDGSSEPLSSSAVA